MLSKLKTTLLTLWFDNFSTKMLVVHVAPSLAMMVDDNDDKDMYTDDDDDAAHNASLVQTTERDEGLVNIEAEEVPPGEETPDQSSEEEMTKNKSLDSSESSETGSDNEDDKSSAS